MDATATRVTYDDGIELCSGRYFYFDRPFDWDIGEIIHSLSNQCRFTGHCKQFYSVAEHSVLCSLLAEETGYCDPFEALMHDAHESVLSDMARPWKPHIAGFSEIEKNLESSMRAAFKLPAEPTRGCKRIDYIAVFLEAQHLLKSKGNSWVDPLQCRLEALRLKELGWKVRCLKPEDARNAFYRRFKEVSY